MMMQDVELSFSGWPNESHGVKVNVNDDDDVNDDGNFQTKLSLCD